MKVPPPSPGQKAYILALGKDVPAEESEIESETEEIENTEGQQHLLLPGKLLVRFDSRDALAGRKALEDYCFEQSKSCVQRRDTSTSCRGGTIAVFTCPYCYDTRAKAGAWRRKREREEEDDEDTHTQEAEGQGNDGDGPAEENIVCPFCMVLRRKSANKRVYWEFDEAGCEHEHDREECPAQHKTPTLVIDEHPVFLAEMAKAKEKRR
eukprot:125052-Rhodomonas_salina.1